MYRVCKFKVRCYKIPYGAPNALYCVNFAENALFSGFGVADAKLLDFSLSMMAMVTGSLSGLGS
jgi:hypothetical protein